MKTPGELVTTANPSPQPYFVRLAATVEQLGATRSVLRQVIALAYDSATLSSVRSRAETCTWSLLDAGPGKGIG